MKTKRIGLLFPTFFALAFSAFFSPVGARHGGATNEALSVDNKERAGVQDDDAVKSDIQSDSAAFDRGEVVPDEKDATHYKHFIAHNKTMTCSADEHALPFNNQIRGTNVSREKKMNVILYQPA
jgi:hypothetical protein